MAPSQKKSPLTLSDEQKSRFEAIRAELQQDIDDAAYFRAIDTVDEALDELGEGDDALRAALLVQRAELYVDADDSEAAIADVRTALGLGYTHRSLYGVAGWAYYNVERYEQARDNFVRALEHAPDDETLLMGHALVLLELGEYEQARAELTHALAIDESSAELYAMRSEVHLHMKDLEAAERDIRMALELEPDDPEYALDLTRLLMVSGRLDEALSVVDLAVGDYSSVDLEALLLRSHMRLLAGRSKEARDDAMRASNHFPDEAFAFVQLAHVQLAEGNANLATRAAERAVGLDPSLPDSYMVRGAALQLTGRLDEAREDFERASQAPAELPMLLLGPAYDVLDASGFNVSLMDMLNQQTQGGGRREGAAGAPSMEELFAGLGGLGGLGGPGGAGGMGAGMDPMQMLGQIFDESGNIRGPLKPFFEMAFRNAPKIMQNMPPGLLGGFDPSQLQNMDLSNLSSEQIEEQMREFYKMMKSGQGKPGSDDDPDE